MSLLKSLFLFVCISSYSLLYGQNYSSFNHISPRIDNKTIVVNKTVEDALGNIWMSFVGGILIYDGYDYKLIKNNTIFSKWKQNDKISNLVIDFDKNIWVLTRSGLVSKYVAKQGNFIDLSSLIKEPVSKIYTKDGRTIWFITKNYTVYNYVNSKIYKIDSIPNNPSPNHNISGFNVVNSNELYIGTSNGKIYRYSLATRKLEEIVEAFSGFPANLILTTDNNNRLWIGTETYGLFVYDIAKKEFIQDTFFSTKKFNINKELFLSLFYDSNGYIWGGTDGGGLYKINSNNGKIDLFTKQSSNDFSLTSNTILDINEDKHKNIWISTNYGKLNVLPSNTSNIKYHSGSEDKSPQRILSIYKSHSGDLWLGTDGNGLTKLTANKTNNLLRETPYFKNIALNKGFYVQSITEDKNANIWFGTYKNGLFFHNIKKNTFRKITITNTKNQVATDIRTVYTDSKGRIWVGSNISVNIYNSNLKLIASFENNQNGLRGFNVESFIEDDNGTIWLGLYDGGLFQFNENNTNINDSVFTNYLYKNTTSNDEIYTAKYLCLGEANELYLINNNGKLLKFNTKDKIYTTFDHIESLNEQQFASILKEDSHNFWLSTNNGICHLNIKKGTLKKYYTADGFNDIMFLPRSAFKDKDGMLYFGNIKGVNYFNPKELDKKESYGKLHIKDIEILNQPIDSLRLFRVTGNAHRIHSLKLKHNQSSFSFRFSAIDNILNPRHHYAYKLKGFDKDWITNHSERVATYTNIPPGNYVFEVKAGSEKNNWNIAAKQIHITIEQTLWKKPFAYVLYFFAFLLIVYGVRRWYLLKKRLFLEKIDHKKKNELHQLKMNFFAKMSHEIQTPITLILSPIDIMIQKAEQNGNRLLKQRLTIISDNAIRLSKIARELTLVRNKELNTLKLVVAKNNLVKDITKISFSFKELARQKQIDFAVNHQKNFSEVWYDKDKIEHIIYNLLSNAFKFTPKNGNIQLNITSTDDKKKIKISIIDSGVGIKEKELKKIFNLFYQSKKGRKIKGSGIGLALTKELIALHKGKIEVESAHTKGTTFTITIPILEKHYDKSEKETIYFEEKKAPSLIENNNFEEKNTVDVSKKTILIAEDNHNLQIFLKELLLPHYNIILAENGEDGYTNAKNHLPDLIVSDIMMPKLDGVEMCKKLQETDITKHIPVILLTAKNSANSKISGLKSGAIEYINKPFNTNELLLKIRNIILSKEHIISKYRREIISKPEIQVEKSQDEVFLDNLVSNINLRLEDPNFKMEELSSSLNISYSSLYRKCQTLTGYSLIDFVRIMRLKKAAVLITEYGYTISESAFMTGFNDPKYFSRCFKKHFKVTPVQYKKNAKTADIIDDL